MILYWFVFQFKDSVLRIMSGVEVNRLNLVTKVAAITAYSTKRVDNILSQSTQVSPLLIHGRDHIKMFLRKKRLGQNAGIGGIRGVVVSYLD